MHMLAAAKYNYQLQWVDWTVIVLYLTMILSIGFIFKGFSKNSKDYFVGGNKVSWWLAGASCFMMSFTAWTFTGMAGFAYKYGILVILLSLGHGVLAYVFASLFVAHRCRQTRNTTWLQIVFERYGRFTEQLFAWIYVPVTIFSGGIWLFSVGMFISIATGIPIQATILISGLIIIIYSTIGGSWGVIASDFIQALIMMSLTIVIAALVLIKIGGFGGLVNKISPEHLRLIDPEHTKLWIVAYITQGFFVFNGIQLAPRFLSVKDGKAARKAGLFAASLFVISPLLFFIPPLAASYFYPDIAAQLPADFKNPHEGAYVLMGLTVLPHGLTALMIMVIFAATMSTLDATMNQNAALITMNLYKPLFRKNADDKELFVVGHIFNALFGTCAILLAIFLATQNKMNLFDLNIFMASALLFPMVVPFFLIYWFKKTPTWSAAVSVLCGFVFSFLSQHSLIMGKENCWACWLIHNTGIDKVIAGICHAMGSDYSEHAGWWYPIQIFGVITIGGGAYLLSSLFWKFTDQTKKHNIATFYKKMNTPVDASREVVGSEDNRQLIVVGTMTMIIGSGILLLLLAPNTWQDRLAILATGSIVLVIGTGLYFAGRRSKLKLEAKQQEILSVELKKDIKSA